MTDAYDSQVQANPTYEPRAGDGSWLDQTPRLIVDGGLPAVRSVSRALLPRPLEELEEVASMLAGLGALIPPVFQGSKERCLGVAFQAAIWNLNPVFVAQKSYVTRDGRGGERIGYEAQLIMALINAQRRSPSRSCSSFTAKARGGTAA